MAEHQVIPLLRSVFTHSVLSLLIPLFMCQLFALLNSILLLPFVPLFPRCIHFLSGLRGHLDVMSGACVAVTTVCGVMFSVERYRVISISFCLFVHTDLLCLEGTAPSKQFTQQRISVVTKPWIRQNLLDFRHSSLSSVTVPQSRQVFSSSLWVWSQPPAVKAISIRPVLYSGSFPTIKHTKHVLLLHLLCNRMKIKLIITDVSVQSVGCIGIHQLWLV